jgi:hypothetical protein
MLINSKNVTPFTNQKKLISYFYILFDDDRNLWWQLETKTQKK